MTSVPFGDVLEDTGSLPDDLSEGAEVSALPDSEDARILRLYNAAILAHWHCATGRDSTNSGKTQSERRYSRRVLTATDGEEAETRKWLCGCADLDESKVRKAAVAAIDAAERAQQKAGAVSVPSETKTAPRRHRATGQQTGRPKGSTKPAPVKRWTATEFLDYALANSEQLEQLGELDAAVDEAARLERLSRRGCYARAKTMAQEPAATHAERYIETYTPDMAAE